MLKINFVHSRILFIWIIQSYSVVLLKVQRGQTFALKYVCRLNRLKNEILIQYVYK